MLSICQRCSWRIRSGQNSSLRRISSANGSLPAVSVTLRNDEIMRLNLAKTVPDLLPTNAVASTSRETDNISDNFGTSERQLDLSAASSTYYGQPRLFEEWLKPLLSSSQIQETMSQQALKAMKESTARLLDEMQLVDSKKALAKLRTKRDEMLQEGLVLMSNIGFLKAIRMEMMYADVIDTELSRHMSQWIDLIPPKPHFSIRRPLVNKTWRQHPQYYDENIEVHHEIAWALSRNMDMQLWTNVLVQMVAKGYFAEYYPSFIRAFAQCSSQEDVWAQSQLVHSSLAEYMQGCMTVYQKKMPNYLQTLAEQVNVNSLRDTIWFKDSELNALALMQLQMGLEIQQLELNLRTIAALLINSERNNPWQLVLQKAQVELNGIGKRRQMISPGLAEFMHPSFARKSLHELIQKLSQGSHHDIEVSHLEKLGFKILDRINTHVFMSDRFWGQFWDFRDPDRLRQLGIQTTSSAPQVNSMPELPSLADIAMISSLTNKQWLNAPARLFFTGDTTGSTEFTSSALNGNLSQHLIQGNLTRARIITRQMYRDRIVISIKNLTALIQFLCTQLPTSRREAALRTLQSRLNANVNCKAPYYYDTRGRSMWIKAVALCHMDANDPLTALSLIRSHFTHLIKIPEIIRDKIKIPVIPREPPLECTNDVLAMTVQCVLSVIKSIGNVAARQIITQELYQPLLEWSAHKHNQHVLDEYLFYPIFSIVTADLGPEAGCSILKDCAQRGVQWNPAVFVHLYCAAHSLGDCERIGHSIQKSVHPATDDNNAMFQWANPKTLQRAWQMISDRQKSGQSFDGEWWYKLIT